MVELYSVRMRSARGDYHISGAERLVPWSEIPQVAAELVKRAQGHERGVADFINVVVEKVDEARLLTVPALGVTTIVTDEYGEGRTYAGRLLGLIGIPSAIVEQAMSLLTDPAQQMRGAVLLDIASGVRLEGDQERGVRASRMDACHRRRKDFIRLLQTAGLAGEHTREALILATKVCHAPGVVAELCWSDDPGYTAGYVASKKYGYVRFPYLKPHGLAQGGRVFFFDSQAGDCQDAIMYLEKQPVLVEPVQWINPPMKWEEFEMQGMGNREKPVYTNKLRSKGIDNDETFAGDWQESIKS